MPAELFDRPNALPIASRSEAAFAARPRLIRLRDALTRAAERVRPPRWGEPSVFFFDRKRQAELEAARPAPPNRFAELTARVKSEVAALVASVELRRVARAVGLKDAARALTERCEAAKELAELLAVPDDEVFLALAPAQRIGVRLHLRGAADAGQLHRLLAPYLKGDFQLFLPGAIRPDGTLPVGFAGCEHWLWPTQPLAAVPRVNGERVVLVAPAAVRVSLDVEPRFPELAVECEVIESLNAFQVAEQLSRLCGRSVPVHAPVAVPPVARAA